ncbi:dynein axonemal assembly factor 11 [Cylas formicarius]|uniref:dynein axonemal assembly factor 11 n=1 Tax=Cylas formicarius TaxID=197179 RepID=UPI00295853F2|nr:dynein axonemal assembly factor 11 [Cylas formicarius]
MVLITEELVRKKAEHNEGLIGTLEELSLHQEDVEKIEHLDKWCRDLQILYLQANQISKIENLNKLKKLEYLNLAINNIERIENLERCESLQKLDLTLNFIGELESVKTLQANTQLRELYLTGNPCCDFQGYREYVVAHLPQLKALDIKEITRGERIKAQQNLKQVEETIWKCQAKYMASRSEQKLRLTSQNNSHLTDDEFWKTVSENSPETRREICARQRKGKSALNTAKAPTNKVRLFNKDGRPLNVNQARLEFKFSDEDPEKFVLDVAVYKYLDTNLIDVDLQPIYVKLTIKGKVFQIVFPEEIHVEKSAALRSQTTGHLLLTLPKINYKAPIKSENNSRTIKPKGNKPNREFLEVRKPKEDMDFSKIVENYGKGRQSFEDNPEVPMLEYA